MLARFLLLVLVTHAASAQSRLTNLSVRSNAGTDAATLIVGFSIGGNGTKSVLVRGVGPTLATFGVSGAVNDPQLQLFAGSSLLQQNDNWAGTQALTAAFVGVGAFALANDSRDSAMLAQLAPGSYSAQLVAASGPGVALVECYDVERGTGPAYFANVSARTIAGSGANVLTVGFGISGTASKAVLIRGIGPALAPFGVEGALAVPRLRLFDSAGIQIASNHAWSAGVTPPVVFSLVGAFPLTIGSRDTTLLLGLQPGTYTAQVDGANNATGAALIELYEVNSAPVPVFTLLPVVAPGLPPPADPGAGTPSPGPDTLPVVRTQTRPVYPIDHRIYGVTGEVLVDFYVKTDGTVANAAALRATDVRLATAAVTAVSGWTFVSARRNGALVTAHMQVPIIFTLDE